MKRKAQTWIQVYLSKHAISDFITVPASEQWRQSGDGRWWRRIR